MDHGKALLTKVEGSSQYYFSVLHHNGQPSYGGDHNTFEVMTST
jgi:hypothetical protein